MKRPERNEYAPGYQAYIDLVETGNFIELLDQNTISTIAFFKSIDKKNENLRYAENKWTIKEVLMHIIDTERGFSYRAIVCTRNDRKIPLHYMDEEFYAQNVDVTEIPIDNLIEEFLAVRQAFKLIYTNNPIEKFSFLGNALEYNISARALGFIAIGHVTHHINIIKERYLS